jgi:hypothetical protein
MPCGSLPAWRKAWLQLSGAGHIVFRSIWRLLSDSGTRFAAGEAGTENAKPGKHDVFSRPAPESLHIFFKKLLSLHSIYYIRAAYKKQ